MNAARGRPGTQELRRLQEQGTSLSWSQSPQRSRRKPSARVPPMFLVLPICWCPRHGAEASVVCIDQPEAKVPEPDGREHPLLAECCPPMPQTERQQTLQC